MQGGLPIVVDGEVIGEIGRASTRRSATCKSRKPSWQPSHFIETSGINSIWN
jgi:hypothetical protein